MKAGRPATRNDSPGRINSLTGGLGCAHRPVCRSSAASSTNIKALKAARMDFSVILDLGCHNGARFKQSIRRRACRNRGSVRGYASEAIMREAGGLWKETLPLA